MALFLFTFLWPSSIAPSTGLLQVPGQDGTALSVDVRLPVGYYTLPVQQFYRDTVDRMFAPWTCLADPTASSSTSTLKPIASRKGASGSPFCHKPVTASSLAAVEWLAKGGAYRIRFTGTKILYRPLQVFGQTYRVQRLHWIMDTIAEMNHLGLLKRKVDGKQGKFEFPCTS